jgi:hypothetical protein
LEKTFLKKKLHIFKFENYDFLKIYLSIYNIK